MARTGDDDHAHAQKEDPFRNDSASGGRNVFFISDEANELLTVTAGAPQFSLFINSTGRVGLGTNNPVLHLHLNKSDTPAIRLEQINSGGLSAQTWDVAGNEAPCRPRFVVTSFNPKIACPSSWTVMLRS